MRLKGIYNLPQIKQTFLVIDSSHMSEKSLCLFEEISEHLLDILKTKNPMENSENWKYDLVTTGEFLCALSRIYPDQSFCYPDSMEILAINISKTPNSFSDNKILGLLKEEDVIEVFV